MAWSQCLLFFDSMCPMTTPTYPPLSYVQYVLHQMIPNELAEDWDNVGFLVVATADHSKVQSIMICNDLTPAVMQEAISKKVDLIISYHPPLSKPVLGHRQEALIKICFQHGISLYSPHTALDAINGGVNDCLLIPFGDVDGFIDVQPILVKNFRNEKPPPGYIGMGRRVIMKQPITIAEIVWRVKILLKIPFVRVAYSVKHNPDTLISCVSACAGSGRLVLRHETSQLLLTGEMDHHEVLEANMRGSTVILMGHCNSERVYLESLVNVLNHVLNRDKGEGDLSRVKVFQSSCDRDPFTLM